jgi:DNA-binding NarL/FixJ family response regulator
VSNGREAVRLARELTPDVVVMDISMPDLNGIEAARQIRVRAPSVRIVMLSMHANREHVHQALAAGAEGYVLKEGAATEVATAVRAVAAGRRYLSPAIESAMLEAGGSAARGPLESLSARERQVLQLVVEGKSSAAIAHTVHLSPKTVETYRSRLMKKLGVAEVTALVKFAVQHGLTPPG